MGIEVPMDMPPCMIEAWELIEEDRAFVAILVQEDELKVVCSKGTVEQIRQLPNALQFISPETDHYTRASFLFSGVMEVATPREEPE